jgi:hypothetical protein
MRFWHRRTILLRLEARSLIQLSTPQQVLVTAADA